MLSSSLVKNFLTDSSVSAVDSPRRRRPPQTEERRRTNQHTEKTSRDAMKELEAERERERVQRPSVHIKQSPRPAENNDFARPEFVNASALTFGKVNEIRQSLWSNL